MLKTISLFILLNFLVSCGSAPKAQIVETVETIKKPEIKDPDPVVEENPTAKFRMLKNDIELPTEDQLADGAETSLGQAKPGDSEEDLAPTTTIKPPKSPVEDQLAPSE